METGKFSYITTNGFDCHENDFVSLSRQSVPKQLRNLLQHNRVGINRSHFTS